MRLAVYCDYSYRLEDGRLSAQLPFARFVEGLVPHCERLVVTGRLDPSPDPFPYSMEGVAFVPQPYYASGAQFGRVIRAIPAGAHRFWRMLDDVDVVWILGPNPPHVFVFALVTLLRRRRLVLGVRQVLPELIRHRHPDKPLVKLSATVLETAFQQLARIAPTVVVGPDLARRYRRAAALHVTYVSRLHDDDLLASEDDDRSYDGPELRMLHVGRLEPEKNPLLIVDVLERALRLDPRWHVDVCGDGSLAAELAQRFEDAGLADRVSLHGYVAVDSDLWDLYRRSHALLHVSLSEGFPQVLLEAFAARLPVVATSVGGVPEVVRGRGWLVPPDDADAAARALLELSSSAELRTKYVEGAVDAIRKHTLEHESVRLAAFLDADREQRAEHANRGAGLSSAQPAHAGLRGGEPARLP